MGDRIITPDEQAMLVMSLEEFIEMVIHRLVALKNDINNLVTITDTLQAEIDQLKQQKGEGVKE